MHDTQLQQHNQRRMMKVSSTHVSYNSASFLNCLNDANNPRTKVTCEKRFTCKMCFCFGGNRLSSRIWTQILRPFFIIDWFTDPPTLLFGKLKKNKIENLCILFPPLLIFILIMERKIN